MGYFSWICEYTYPLGSTNWISDGETETVSLLQVQLVELIFQFLLSQMYAESSTPNYYEASTGGSTAVAGVALDYGVVAGYVDADC